MLHVFEAQFLTSFHSFGVGEVFYDIPGVPRGGTPGDSNGILPGCGSRGGCTEDAPKIATAELSVAGVARRINLWSLERSAPWRNGTDERIGPWRERRVRTV